MRSLKDLRRFWSNEISYLLPSEKDRESCLLALLAGWLVFDLNQILVDWCGLVRGKFGGVRIRETDITDIAFGGLLCDPFKIGEGRVVSYQQVRESERTLTQLLIGENNDRSGYIRG